MLYVDSRLNGIEAKDRSCCLLFVGRTAAATAAAAAASFLGRAGTASVGTADAFFTAFLCFIHIVCSCNDDGGNDNDNDEIFHGNNSLKWGEFI